MGISHKPHVLSLSTALSQPSTRSHARGFIPSHLSITHFTLRTCWTCRTCHRLQPLASFHTLVGLLQGPRSCHKKTCPFLFSHSSSFNTSPHSLPHTRSFDITRSLHPPRQSLHHGDDQLGACARGQRQHYVHYSQVLEYNRIAFFPHFDSISVEH